jgi:flagellar protein FlaF
MHSNPKTAYEKISKKTIPGREVEASVLSQAAQRLKACQEQLAMQGASASLIQALKYNQQLWTIFQVELAENDHPMPTDLRVSLLRLSQFIDRRTFDIMASPTAEKLSILIDINKNIASGLLQQQRDAAA